MNKYFLPLRDLNCEFGEVLKLILLFDNRQEAKKKRLDKLGYG